MNTLIGALSVYLSTGSNTYTEKSVEFVLCTLRKNRENIKQTLSVRQFLNTQTMLILTCTDKGFD